MLDGDDDDRVRKVEKLHVILNGSPHASASENEMSAVPSLSSLVSWFALVPARFLLAPAPLHSSFETRHVYLSIQ